MTVLNPQAIVLLYLVTTSHHSVVQSAPDGCPQVDYGYGWIYAKPEFGKCYLFVDIERYWHEASNACRSNGGYLVTVSDRAIQSYVEAEIEALGFGRNGYWIGAHDRGSEGNFTWDSGASWSYTNWASGEPDNGCGWFCTDDDCVTMRSGNNYQWDDYPCYLTGYTYSYIYYMLPITTTPTITEPTTTMQSTTTPIITNTSTTPIITNASTTVNALTTALTGTSTTAVLSTMISNTSPQIKTSAIVTSTSTDSAEITSQTTKTMKSTINVSSVQSTKPTTTYTPQHISSAFTTPYSTSKTSVLPTHNTAESSTTTPHDTMTSWATATATYTERTTTALKPTVKTTPATTNLTSEAIETLPVFNTSTTQQTINTWYPAVSISIPIGEIIGGAIGGVVLMITLVSITLSMIKWNPIEQPPHG